MKRIVCWRTSNSNLFGGSSSDDFTSDVSANAATASGMIAILNYETAEQRVYAGWYQATVELLLIIYCA